MTRFRKAGLRRIAATVGGFAALGVAAVASLALASSPATSSGAAERGGSACALGAAPVADSSIEDVRKSIRCLINEERAVHGFGKLLRNESLQKASQRHTKAMVAADCLAHRCGDEPNLETRLRQAGYFDGVKAWRYAENTGCGESAEAMIANWLASLYHRVNILDPDFEDIGVGISQDRVSGRCDKGYGTFAVVFGERTP